MGGARAKPRRSSGECSVLRSGAPTCMLPAPLRVLDLGAGNGWLAHRATLAARQALALDTRDDDVDGLGAAPGESSISRVVASFEAIPLCDASFDIVVFNASLHYAEDLGRALAEARRVVRPGGRIVVLDSPFYLSAEHGEEMLRVKRRDAERRFGARAEALTALAFVEYSHARAARRRHVASPSAWRRHRVLYPLWYELRAIRAALRGARPPSRFDVWEAVAA
jgi:ubiquinone/menaquinone biosynthesis C-methylase UbiE